MKKSSWNTTRLVLWKWSRPRRLDLPSRKICNVSSMKIAFLPLLFVALLCGVTLPAHALPDSVGVNPFLTQFDENFEDFASDPENFIITAAGRSHWKPVSTPQNIQELQIPAVVFGLQFDPALSSQNLLDSVLTYYGRL